MIEEENVININISSKNSINGNISSKNELNTSTQGKGDTGPKGEDGITYIPEIKKVETLEPTEKASVEVEVEGNKMRFSFSLPRGKPGIGDMQKEIYDSDNDGIIDNADIANKIGRLSSADLETAIIAISSLITEYTSLQRDLISLSKSIEKIPIGGIIEFGGYSDPDGWLICDGREISRTEYANLFNVIGTEHGAGDGEKTFKLPDYRHLFPVGYDANDEDFNRIGKKGGSKFLQEHSHVMISGDYGIASGGQIGVAANLAGSGSPVMSNGVYNLETGNSGNLSPYIVSNFIIKY